MDNFMYIKTMEYSQVNESGTQYDKRRFKIYETVDARYIKNDMYPDNPLICALPPGVSEDELAEASTVVMKFIHDEVTKLPDHSQLEIIGQIKKAKNMNIYLPMYFSFSVNVRECLLSSYGSRNINENDPNLKEISDPLSVYPRIIKEETGTDGGFNMYGASGCGKSTERDPVFSFLPQVIQHPLSYGGSFKQIVYLQVDCPNGNVSDLYERIGIEIDLSLHTSFLNTYRNMLKGNSKTTNSNRATILTELIKSFGIGVIVLDEAQNLRLNDKAVIELLNTSNTTGVNFIFISTKFLFPEYEMTEDNRKILRRFGNEIVADQYCNNLYCFYIIINEICRYQLFVPEIKPIKTLYDENGNQILVPDDLYEDFLIEIRNFSQGRIEAIVKLWIEMNKTYIENGKTDTIDVDFVRSVVETKLYHQGLISENETKEQHKVLQRKMHNALNNKDDKSIPRLPSDTTRETEIYLEMAKEAAADLQPLQPIYSEKTIYEAVNQATTKLAGKNKSFNKDDIKREAVKLLTGGSNRKKSTSPNPAANDEFYKGRKK